MTPEQEALREKVARASYERWRSTRPNAPAFDSLYSDALESELADADAAIAVVLKEASRVAESFNVPMTDERGLGSVISHEILSLIPQS